MTKKSSYYLSTSASFYLTKSGTYITDVDSNVRETNARGREVPASLVCDRSNNGRSETSRAVDTVSKSRGASVTSGTADHGGTETKLKICECTEEDESLGGKSSAEKSRLKNGLTRHRKNCEKCGLTIRADKTRNSSCDKTCNTSCTQTNDESPNAADDVGCTTTHDDKATSETKKLKFSEMPRRSKYSLLCIALVNFGAGCGYSLPAPFFPREVRHAFFC